MSKTIGKTVSVCDDSDIAVDVPAGGQKLPKNALQLDPRDLTLSELTWTRYKAKKDVLVAKCQYFQDMLVLGFAEGEMGKGAGPVITILMEDLDMELWFRVWHGTLNQSKSSYTFSEVRNHIVAAEIFGFESKDLVAWYQGWIQWIKKTKGPDLDTCTEALLPSYFWGDAQTFASATRLLVYNSPGHTVDNERTSHREHYLPGRIFRALNAARGSLRISLHTLADEFVSPLIKSDQTCCAITHRQIERALRATSFWPLEKNRTGFSLSQILSAFAATKVRLESKLCIVCNHDYDEKIKKVVAHVRKDFHGLCLSCMEGEKEPLTNLAAGKEGKIRSNLADWSKTCRIVHGQPSWYFSALARKDTSDFRQRMGPELLRREIDAKRRRRLNTQSYEISAKRRRIE